jgi:hypothetical protein
VRKIFLIVLFLLAFGLPLASAQDELPLGSPITGSMTADEATFRYTFTGEEGQLIYAALSTPVEDLWLGMRLLASSGTLLSESEGYPLGTLLVPYSLPGTGTYTIEVSRIEDSPAQAGQFTLFASTANLIPLTADDTLSGDLTTAGQGAFYSFDAEPGAIYQYHATGNNLLVSFIAPDGVYITDYNVGDTLVSGFNYIAEGGRYLLIIQSANSDGSHFSLRAHHAQPQPLVPGESVSGTMNESSPQLFQFESEAGEQWALSAIVPDAEYAAMIGIFRAGDPYYSIGGDGGSGANGTPKVDPFIAPETDTYYVLLTFDDYTPADATRDYDLLLEASTVKTLLPGAKFDGSVSTDSGSQTYIYNGLAGEQLRITLAKTGGEGWPYFFVEWVNGYLLYYEGYGVSNASFILDLPEDGQYFFTIRNANGEPSEIQYTLSLDQVNN